MSRNSKIGLFASLFVLIGFPLSFLCLSLFSNDWNYLRYSVGPSFAAGFTTLILCLRQIKKERHSE